MPGKDRLDFSHVIEGGPPRGVPEVRGFEVLRRIGQGGMGEVYVARQEALNRLVAIKFLRPEGEPDPEPDLVRFRREAELMAKVSHPNILSVFDFGEVDGRPFLVMEYVEGGDLRRRMRAGHPMPADQVRAVVVPVGEALAYLHRNGILHRDLKPENILLHDGDHPRVSDFGVAVLRAGSGSLTQTGRGIGTLGYVAPEQQYRLKVDERADQFSLAAMAYEMLTGQLPLGVFKPPSELNPRLGPEVDAVILRALQEDPKERFATVREFTAALDRGLAGGRPGSAAPRSAALSWAGWAVVSLSVAVSAAALYLAWPAAPGAAATPQAPPLGPRLQPPPGAPRLGPDPGSPPPSGPAPSTPKAEATRLGEGLREAPPSLQEELKRLQAHQIWKARGSPTGPAGEAVKDEIWFEAVRKVESDLKLIAYQIWKARGGPTGPAGEAVRGEIWAQAEAQLYRALSGKAPPAPKARPGRP